MIRDFAPENARLLEKRDKLQAKIDAYYNQTRRNKSEISPEQDDRFLRNIGYIVGNSRTISSATETPHSVNIVNTQNLDPEITSIPGPQLVVPVDNARYALNAANARWGSLLDAIYGTDAIDGGDSKKLSRGKESGYDPKRGKEVFRHAEGFLDDNFPLTKAARYSDVIEISVVDGGFNGRKELLFKTANGFFVSLHQPGKFVGYAINGGSMCVLLRNNRLHVELQIDRHSRIGKTHRAGLKDILLESAVTTICDMEDSVAAVDAEDKQRVYRNWAGLMRGTLSSVFKNKYGKTVKRRLSNDRKYACPLGGDMITLPGRSLLLVRNVGLHMYTDAVVTSGRGGGGEEMIPEGLLDLAVTCLAAIHDLKKTGDRNIPTGSVYVVKPKMHGPEEVEFVQHTFARVEKILGLAKNTVKIGIMDEERRTTINLRECLEVAKDRVFFINTGFLDRTGDEIHTAMCAGAVLPKSQLKEAVWKSAYEAWNVEVGLASGLRGCGQIGKGMWAAPDEMHKMLKSKAVELEQGASCAWVPSPTAATLHAIHYHQVDVSKVQAALESRSGQSLSSSTAPSFSRNLRDILTLPLLLASPPPRNTVLRELENNAQGILGYVARWVHEGVGCSKIPDINNVGLMEDRATLRISSQHIANWLKYNIVRRDDVLQAFRKMAGLIDSQNAERRHSGSSPTVGNRPPAIATNFESDAAVRASLDLVFEGTSSPNGYMRITSTERQTMMYTEPILTKCRKIAKAQQHDAKHFVR
eukprot:jgi/Bigna1/55067/estExt_Genewise1Plus.C_500029